MADEADLVCIFPMTLNLSSNKGFGRRLIRLLSVVRAWVNLEY